MTVMIPKDLPTQVRHFWYYDVSLQAIREHDYPDHFEIPRGRLEWCPQILPGAEGPRKWIVMLHDHRCSGGYFYAIHTGKNGPIRYTAEGATKRALTLNGAPKNNMIYCPDAPTFAILDYLIPDSLKNLQSHTKSELIGLIKDMLTDWQHLNMIHNMRADERAWCSVYEGNQSRYNTRFRVMRLTGRPELRGGALAGL